MNKSGGNAAGVGQGNADVGDNHSALAFRKSQKKKYKMKTNSAIEVGYT